MSDDRERSDELAQEFVRFAVESGVLRFGEFKTKAGRMSPYFFNAGLFDDGAKLGRLAEFYAKTIAASGIGFDMLFGPAYKGIPLAVALALELAQRGRTVPFCFNRKEAKDHGEGGQLIGAPLKGRVLIVDDVISAGTSAREAVDTIRAAGANAGGMLIALDRGERGQGTLSATDEVRARLGIDVHAIAGIDELIAYLAGEPDCREHWQAVTAYRKQYGVFNA